ncbi:MAG: hypothetical protein CBB68_14425 [Rhodospirillaceae bacterium TMED8]|nr:hypothetical protein [Magnetovibrio sp.]OUT48146.1 MAG: hypothetical protein CBB68_14425 [Rhodospirillaceae bacterium TMED8]|tara:strand:+ start:2586 stop:2879 length:294 start_codon:yes stop_codon:yes gene_type:complete
MLVEIGSMTSLRAGQKVYEVLKTDERVQFVFLETGRSNDLFDEKQFGEFGEAAVLTVLVDENDKADVFNRIYESAELHERDQGIISLNTKVVSDFKS